MKTFSQLWKEVEPELKVNFKKTDVLYIRKLMLAAWVQQNHNQRGEGK